MDADVLRSRLQHLPIAALRYYDVTGSTNQDALEWIEDGADEYSLVVADSQTAGRGRMGRRWETHPGAALAFSLILKPREEEKPCLSLFSPLCAVAVALVLINVYRLKGVQVKWPNDVLIERRKVCGILVESAWEGDSLLGIAAGVGINVLPEALPPDEQLLFPATCVETQVGKPVDRIDLLAAVLGEIMAWRPHLTTGQLIQTWDRLLAFKGEAVRLEHKDCVVSGKLWGIAQDGSLCIQTETEGIQKFYFGDVHLRPEPFCD